MYVYIVNLKAIKGHFHVEFSNNSFSENVIDNKCRSCNSTKESDSGYNYLMRGVKAVSKYSIHTFQKSTRPS